MCDLSLVNSILSMLVFLLFHVAAGANDGYAQSFFSFDNPKVSLSYRNVSASDFRSVNDKIKNIIQSDSQLNLSEFRNKESISGFEVNSHSFDFEGKNVFHKQLNETFFFVQMAGKVKADSPWVLHANFEVGNYADTPEEGESRDFFEETNAKMRAKFLYSQSKHLSWILGGTLDVWKEIPVLPTFGILWTPESVWSASVTFPETKVSYDLNEKILLFAKFTYHDQTYKVRNIYKISNEDTVPLTPMEYRELLLSFEGKWKITSKINISVETGQMIFRKFVYHKENQVIESASSSHFSQIATQIAL
ncbi:DUF6268 family outer membrane beta-barrel protein [Deltaproteobacteria bacterium TL4]